MLFLISLYLHYNCNVKYVTFQVFVLLSNQAEASQPRFSSTTSQYPKNPQAWALIRVQKRTEDSHYQAKSVMIEEIVLELASHDI
jgi:hypothetical protein